MRVLILLASIGALVIAKPEKYREKEDFEYSRSSSDDGSKSGFYGAQRGNMGGNYEHAHNMDTLAQHQMSSLVRQVDGELGSGANQRTGSVFTSGNSRGVYGSGMYDLSNLKGRNFEESHAFGGSHSSLSSSSGAASSLGYGHEHASNSRYSSSQSQNAIESSRYNHHSSAQSASDLVMGGHQAESLHDGLTQSEYDQQAANNYKYYSGSSGYNSNSRYVSSVPTKVYIRPGQTVQIPISSQTYDASHLNAHLHEQNSLNSDAEVISSGRVVNTLPITKHYESSYKYKKEWEKHDTQTFATPTENPFSQNIEQFDNLQVSQGAHRHDNFDVNSLSSSQLNKFNSAQSNAFSTGGRTLSSHQSGYHSDLAAESQHLDSSFAGSHSKDYLHEGIGARNVVEDVNSRPKHYRSSYSYHKAWERQGDPYVIVPDSSSGGSEVQSSQKFTAASENYGHSSSHRGSQYSQSQKGYSSGCNIDCVNGHIRIARSYKTDPKNVEQQSQTEWANVEDLGQQTQENWDHLAELGQQTQNNWENLGQQTQENWDHLGDLTQQQQSKWENQEDLGQNIQNNWDNLENLNQQSQTKWDKIEVMDQQHENKDDKQAVESKPHNAWNKIEDLEQKPNVDLETPVGKLTPTTQENVSNRPRYVSWHEFQNFGPQDSWNNGNHHVHHGHHHHSIGQEEQTYKYHNMHDILNQEYENWKLMQSLSQHLGNTQRENYFNKYSGNNMNSQQGGYLFGHRHDSNCHHSQDASISNTNYQNAWNADAQGNNYHKHFSDVWNNEYSNGGIFIMQQEPDSIPMQTHSDNGKQDLSIHNFWDNLDKINLHKENHDFESTEQAVKEQNQSNTNVEKNVNIDEDKDESVVIHPVDVGRGDIGAEDLASESMTTEKNNKYELNSNLNHIVHTTDTQDKTTTENYLDLNVIGLETKPRTELKVNSTNQQSLGPSNVEQKYQHSDIMQHNDRQVEDWIRHLKSDTQQDFGHDSLDQQSEDFNHPQTNADQQLEDLGLQQNTDQQLEDFGQQQDSHQQFEDFKKVNSDQQLEDIGQQQDSDQQLEDFKKVNSDQQLEDFGQQQDNHQQFEDLKKVNSDQQLQDFGQQQDSHQQLEDFKKVNSDQQFEDIRQQQSNNQQFEHFKHVNTDQQLEDIGQHQNTDQQLEDFGQQQNNNQQLEDFMQLNTDQQLVDFGQQSNTDQQLQDFGQQHNTNQQLEDFKQLNSDQHLEDFGQQPNTDQHQDFTQQMQDQQLETFNHFDHLSEINKHKQEFEEPRGRSLESAIPAEPVTTTEKPGFWKSVGNKFTGAKDTVAGWFKRS